MLVNCRKCGNNYYSQHRNDDYCSDFCRDLDSPIIELEERINILEEKIITIENILKRIPILDTEAHSHISFVDNSKN
jgi:hypothetical protein